MEAVGEAVVGALVDRLISQIEAEIHLFRGVKKNVKKLKSKLSAIQTILEDAETNQFKEKYITEWLIDLKNAACEAEDALEEWAIQVRPAAGAGAGASASNQVSRSVVPACFNFNKPLARRSMAKRLIEILDTIENNENELKVFDFVKDRIHGGQQQQITGAKPVIPNETGPNVDQSSVFGRSGEKQYIIDTLLGDMCSQKKVSIYPIHGMGGMGKTTLAKLIFNDEGVKNAFLLRTWVHVSESFDVKKILKEIIGTGAGTSGVSNEESLTTLQSKVGEKLTGKKYLLVLDDVWEVKPNEWNTLLESVLDGAIGSSIILTTRFQSVASLPRTLPEVSALEALLDDDCWALFKKCALGDDKDEKDYPQLVQIGKDIVKNCGGLPLSASSLGSSLWSTTDVKQWLLVKNSEIWKSKDDETIKSLRLSYNRLPSDLRQCFAYCAIFPKDFQIKKDELVRLWIANGFIKSEENMELEEVGDDKFNKLLSRHFFQDTTKDESGNIETCKMHHCMHHLARFVMVSEFEMVKVGERGTFPNNTTRHVSLICESVPPPTALDPLFECQPQTPFRSVISFSVSPFDYPSKLIDFSNLTRLRVLDLSNMRIGTLPPPITILKLLRYLKLCNTSITSLDNLEGLGSLQMLDLSRNKGIRTLPNSIRVLKSLRYLNLSSCEEIRSLPDIICELENLRSLILLGCTALSEFPENMGNMKNLRLLDVRDCPKFPTTEIGESVPSEIPKLVVLKGPSGGTEVLPPVQTSGPDDLFSESNSKALLKGLELPPNIQVLSIKGYRWEASLPEGFLGSSNVLRSLTLNGCDRLQRLPVEMENLTALTSLRIENCKALDSLPVELQKLTSFERLEIINCGSLKCFPVMGTRGSKASLLYLEIQKCQNLESLTEGLWHQAALKNLDISSCPKLELGKEDFQHLVSLHTLKLVELPKLKALPEGIQQLRSLERLYALRCPELELATKDFQNLHALQTLEIWGLRKLEELPEGMKDLTILQYLEIRYCKNLKRFPEWMHCLTSLQVLRFADCHPYLHERCQKNGEDWHKISHIPEIYVQTFQAQ